jgi:hypothetical protein
LPPGRLKEHLTARLEELAKPARVAGSGVHDLAPLEARPHQEAVWAAKEDGRREGRKDVVERVSQLLVDRDGVDFVMDITTPIVENHRSGLRP